VQCLEGVVKFGTSAGAQPMRRGICCFSWAASHIGLRPWKAPQCL
jgi:hypothetical protein